MSRWVKPLYEPRPVIVSWPARIRSSASFCTFAADTPFIPRDRVARLHGAREMADVPLACAASGGFAGEALCQLFMGGLLLWIASAILGPIYELITRLPV